VPTVRLLTAAIPPVLAGGAAAVALSGQRWAWWGVEAMAPTTSSPTSFADLANITATAQCLMDGQPYEGCDPYGRPFQPYVVLPARLLAAVGWGTSATGALGTALAVVFVATMAGLGWLVARRWAGSTPALVAAQVLLGLLAVTPPVQLAIERGQVELLTLALAVLALVLLSGPLSRTAGGVTRGIVGAVSAVLAVVSKFFAIGLFAPFIRRGRPAWAALAGLGVSAVVLVASWSTLQQASAAARTDLPATSKSQFGSATLVATWLTPDPVGYVPGEAVSADWDRVRLIGWVIALIAVVVAVVLLRRARTPGDATTSLVLGGAGVLAVPYVLGASHDYRLVFLLPVVAGALVWWSGSGPRVPAAVIVVGAAVSMVTAAAMVPTPDGFLWNRWALLAGDLGLLVALAVAGALWAWGLVHRRD
jgi:hypothetical protein